MADVGNTNNPLRVAIIGSGPAGFYVVSNLLRYTDLQVEMDMFERLPTPFGLVRYGVAPDHPKDKSVTRTYDRIAHNPNYRFYGNVQYGKDINLQDLQQHYHQIVFATGAQTDRSLGIPGETLRGNHSAAEFVAWYNGHPDFADLQFDLTREDVVVVGMGNVALDVARILCRTSAELAQTDIADYALEALRNHKIRRIYVLGRRGPAQAAFTPLEIRELGELTDTDVRVLPDEARLDAVSEEFLAANPSRNADKNIACIERYSHTAPAGRKRLLTLRFFVSPAELRGQAGRLTAVRLVKNQPVRADDGSVRARATDIEEILPAGLLFRSVGYRGVALPDVPFNEDSGLIENQQGRVTDTAGKALAGLYVAGWIKRGPSGVIGTNKTCARETVDCMLEDVAGNKLLQPKSADPQTVAQLVRERCNQMISYHDWELIDAAEVSNGKSANRPRVKFTKLDDMLTVLDQARNTDTRHSP
ncbi:MAG: FAD-dependent oxidoreductase [Gammaproteobacteria bacterium]|nr:FAD-dependent oxidoreductase [Gammaproteobacteria bacterium]